MTASTKPYRYQLPKKAIKADCPQCGPRYRKTLSRYIDTKTDEPLPESYGRCDRESNCGYHLSPYYKATSGLSYADEVRAESQLSPLPKEWFRMAGKQKRNGIHPKGFIQCLMEMRGATREEAERVANYVFNDSRRETATQPTQTTPVYYIHDEVFTKSLGHYEQNQFARLLSQRFGHSEALTLLKRFQIGTSARWPGACVFWLKDEQQRVRAGQVVLFADDWHKARYIDQKGESKVCISSVSRSLLRRYRNRKQSVPDWLTDYDQNAPRWPILFGLHQLVDAPVSMPIAIVEAPKTAIVCSALIPNFIWLAVGALSYLNADRLAPLRNRVVKLFPDLSKDGKAFTQWSRVTNDLNKLGYQISVSEYLEQRASDEQKEKGFDLADFLLTSEINRPQWILNGQTILGQVLNITPCNNYPTEWDSDYN